MSLLFGRKRNILIPKPTNASIDAIGSDRLRKAIERNRAKQTKRDPTPPSGYSSGYQRPEESNRPSNYPRPANPMTPRPMGMRPSPPLMGNRPPVSRPLPGIPSRPLPNPSYNTAKKASKFAKYFLRGLWIFSIFLTLRLIFTERGVVEYYSRQGILTGKYEKLESLKIANQNLEKEIKKIRNDSAYQRLLVRNHLGFIARDEFIVLLPD